jgi:tripartite-type tricarboxylate transporter receptor subunit TctC
VQEFIAIAKKEPGKYSFGSGSSSSRIAGELFQQMAGVKLLHVPVQEQPARDHRPAGRPDRHDDHRQRDGPAAGEGRQGARARHVDAASASPLAPDVPTIDEAGVKGYEMGYWFAAYVPAKTPPAVVQKLHDLLVARDQGPRRRSFYESTGTEAVVSTPDELAKFQAAESQKWGRIIKAAGIHAG